MPQDVLRLVAEVMNEAADAAGEDIERLALRRQENLDRKRELSRLEDYYKDALSDNGVLDAEELDNIRAWFADLGLPAIDGNITAGMRVQGGEVDDALQIQRNKDAIDAAIGNPIDSEMELVEDDEQRYQFLLQMGVGDYQNANEVASQGEKRLQQLRSTLVRNWNGN